MPDIILNPRQINITAPATVDSILDVIEEFRRWGTSLHTIDGVMAFIAQRYTTQPFTDAEQDVLRVTIASDIYSVNDNLEHPLYPIYCMLNLMLEEHYPYVVSNLAVPAIRVIPKNIKNVVKLSENALDILCIELYRSSPDMTLINNLLSGIIVSTGTHINNNQINSIELESREISEASACVLAKALTHNTSLTSLDFGRNRIGEAGVHALAEALPYNSSLTSLVLNYNQISSAGVHALAEALRHNNSLTSLNIKYNQISSADAHKLAETLLYNSSIMSINIGMLYNGNIHEEFALGEEAVKRNQRYQHKAENVYIKILPRLLDTSIPSFPTEVRALILDYMTGIQPTLNQESLKKFGFVRHETTSVALSDINRLFEQDPEYQRQTKMLYQASLPELLLLKLPTVIMQLVLEYIAEEFPVFVPKFISVPTISHTGFFAAKSAAWHKAGTDYTILLELLRKNTVSSITSYTGANIIIINLYDLFMGEKDRSRYINKRSAVATLFARLFEESQFAATARITTDSRLIIHGISMNALVSLINYMVSKFTVHSESVTAYHHNRQNYHNHYNNRELVNTAKSDGSQITSSTAIGDYGVTFFPKPARLRTVKIDYAVLSASLLAYTVRYEKYGLNSNKHAITIELDNLNEEKPHKCISTKLKIAAMFTQLFKEVKLTATAHITGEGYLIIYGIALDDLKAQLPVSKHDKELTACVKAVNTNNFHEISRQIAYK